MSTRTFNRIYLTVILVFSKAKRINVGNTGEARLDIIIVFEIRIKIIKDFC